MNELLFLIRSIKCLIIKILTLLYVISNQYKELKIVSLTFYVFIYNFLNLELIFVLLMQTPQSSTSHALDNSPSSAFNINKFRKRFGAIKKKHRDMSLLKDTEAPTPIIKKEKQETDKQNLYFRVRVISKVGVFIEKLKSFVTLSEPNFKYQEMEYIQNQYNQENKDKWLFSPYNKAIITYKIIVLFLSLISVWNASFSVVFHQKNSFPFWLRIAAIAIFTLEMVINFNLQQVSDFNQQEKVGEDRLSVVKNNLKNKLPYDLISLVCLILCEILENDSWIILIARGIVVVKLKTVFYYIRVFRILFITTAENQTKANISVLLLQIFMFVHFLSLFLNAMVIIENNYGVTKTWVSDYGVENSNQLQLYLYGWYWGANLLTTVGLGDVVPGNVYEAFIVSLIQIFCSAFFGFLISYIGGMLTILGQATEQYQKDMRKLNNYLQKVNVSHETKNQIRKQFSYTKQITKIQNPQVEEKILSQLPEHMINDMKAGNNRNLLLDSVFFKRYSHEILTSLAMKLQRIIYSPSQNVFYKGETQTRLWIIEKGSIRQIFNNQSHNQQKIIAEYSPQTSHPGYINFMTGQHFTTYGKSQGFTWTYELKRSSMIDILQMYPIQYYKFCEIRDRMILANKKYISSCYACRKLSHNTIECPKIHFKPQMQVYKLPRYTQQQKCSRQYHPRRDEKHNSRIIYAVVVEELMEKASSNNIISSSKGMAEDIVRKRLGRVSITDQNLRNLSYIQPSIERREDATVDQNRTEVLDLKKKEVVTDLGQFKLNDYYFPENSVNTVLNYYKQFQRNKTEENKTMPK